MSKQKIIVTFEYPPIPDRRFDWRARYDGQEEDGKDGFGSTPLAALADLIENYEDAA